MRANRLRFRLAVAVLLLGGSASAQVPFSDSLVQSPKLALPERGSLAGQYSAIAFGPSDLVRGGFSLPSPFRAPTDRGNPGVDPFPVYSPEAGISEWGLGWQPGGLFLQRWRPTGDLDYANDDLTSPWGHLVRGSDGAWYPIGMQNLVRLDPNAAGFVASLPDGSQWVFDARVNTPSGTYAWYLTSVTTAIGRQTQLSYVANTSGRLYLSQVSYGSSPTLPYQHEIDFAYESTPLTFPDYRSGAALVLDRRVHAVTMKSLVGGVMTERWHYTLGYQSDGLGPAFYLAQVQRTFASGAAEPAVAYDYAAAKERFATVAFRAIPKVDPVVAAYGATVFQANRAALLDVDLDARADFEFSYDDTLFLQQDDSFLVQPLPAPPADALSICRPPASLNNTPRTLAQVRASDDSYQVVSLIAGSSNTLLTLCNRVGQQVYSQNLPTGFKLGPNVRLVDLNRDHQPDLIRVFYGGYQVLPNQSTPAGFSFGAPLTATLTPAVTPSAAWVLDMNGDGIPDLVARTSTSLVVWMGKGNFQFERQGVTLQLFAQSGTLISNLGQYELTFVDANKDGLTDLIATSNGAAFLYVNTGTRYQQSSVPGLSFVDAYSTRLVLADLAGTGDAELALVKSNHAYSMALAGPETGLLRSADDGKGNVLRFAYGRGPPSPGARHRQAVLSALTVQTTGQDAVSYQYGYQTPTLHSTGRFLVGFGAVARQGAALSWSDTFLNSDAFSGVRASAVRHDSNSPQADSFEQRSYEDALYLGIPWKRLKAVVSGVQSPDGAQVASERTDFLTYEADVCARQVQRTGASGTLLTVTTRAQIPGFGNSLHCLPARTDLSGTHADPALDFAYTALLSRNATGQLTQLQSVAASGALTLQSITYNPDFTIATTASPSTGTTTYAYDPLTGMLNEVDGPDGVVTKVFARDPLTDAVLTLQTDRGGSPFKQFYRYDALERLAKRWNDLGTASELNPDETLAYRYASSTLPATIYSSQLVDTGAGASKTSVDCLTGAGASLATASAIPEGWSFGPVTQRLVTTRDTNTYLRASVPPAVDPLGLDYAALLSGATRIQQRRSTIHDHDASSATQLHSDVQRQLVTTLTVSGGGLLESTTENGTLSKLRTRDAGKRVIAYRDEAGTIYGFIYDALGRLRRVDLPDGTKHSQAFDGHGRVASVTREGIATVQTEYDPVNGLPARKTFESRAGVPQRMVEFSYDAIGRRRLATHTDLVSGQAQTYRYFYDGATPATPNLTNDRGQLTAVTGSSYTRLFTHRPDGLLSSRRTVIAGFTTVDLQLTYFEDGAPLERTVSVLAPDGTLLSRSKRSYAVDAYGRPVQLSLNGVPLASLSYDGNGLLSGASFTSGGGIQLSYDPVTRRFSGVSQQATAWSSSTSFRYNARGFVDEETLAVGPSSLERSYRYSDPGYLTAASDAQSSYVYDYDRFGLSTLVQTGSDARVITATSGGVLSAGRVQYRFDSLGRVVQKGDLALEYGPDGNVVRARRGTSEWSFLYDERGQRIAKISGGVLLAAYLEDGVLETTGFTEPLRFGGILVGLVQGSSVRLIPIDIRGTALGDVDGSPNIPSPFGDRTVHPSIASALDYVEKGFDKDLGLIRMGVRDYDAFLGRFLTPDPLFLESLEKCVGGPVQCNLYGYAAGNPLLFVDPSGLDIDVWSREFWAGVAFGTAQAAAPGGFAIPSPYAGNRDFEAGRALGLTATGVAQTISGVAEMTGGGAAAAAGTATAPTGVGVAVAVGGGALVVDGAGRAVQGATNVVAAAAVWANVLSMSAGPEANGGNARQHGGPAHDAAIDQRIAELKEDPSVTNVRKNQQQVDAQGNKVGTNRPDIQYDKDGVHHVVEYDTIPANGTKHGEVIFQNDPNAMLELNTVP
jgi:RHS repeat-associated protein